MAKKNHFWCPYDPVTKEWWYGWALPRKGPVLRALRWEKTYNPNAKRLKVYKVKLVRVRP